MKEPLHSPVAPVEHPAWFPRNLGRSADAVLASIHDAPINILIVDDEARNLTVLDSILDNPGYKLIRAVSPDQALHALVEQEFALLILDIRMPGMTGFELAKMIKGRKKTARVPIIFLTAHYGEDEHVLEGYGSGAVDFLLKPVNPAILRSKVAVFVELHRKSRELETAYRSLLIEVTERRRVEEELRELNLRLEQRVAERTQAAEAANRAKSDFLSAMSHELRSPLNAILGFAQLIETDATPPTDSQQRSVGQILKAGWYLLELINEILDLALIESGKLTLSLQAFSLADVLVECHDLVQLEAGKRDISVRFPQGDCPFVVIGDRTRMKQILINLLSNAVKYNRVGGMVSVQCSVASAGRLRIRVEDSGMGLSDEQLAQLFQPFVRLGQEHGGEQGTGIGLLVCKRLVEQMGGAIGVQSSVGVGSVFWVELNLEAASREDDALRLAHTEPRVEPDASRQCTLLYVEDNPANLMLVQDIVARSPGMHLLSAGEARSGVEIARASLPDVIVLDINLPGISGFEALQLLRADPRTAHIPVIALSANAMARDIEQGLAAGFISYLTKPLRITEFMNTLDAALKVARSRATRIRKDTTT